ncbi:hypothetical protein [Sporocytophaga myxococcoides]|uniref:hypothetical protein n=1 Tax=Sporocytophaga myxococcoides TaxID=153721 RepID=UPI0005EEBB3B|nr:hypothetical protein [Sporocytophaga myxococcoides]
MNSKTAIKIMLWLLVFVMLFHLSIIVKLIPYEITWGGRLKSDIEMYVFETISILINLLLFSILLIKGRYVKEYLSMKVVDIILWIFIILFGLNTIGNILAETIFEKFFTLLTLAFAMLLWIILNKDKNRAHN